MFERFTERARKVVALAQEEAGRLRHDYIGTEHLLLGLVREGTGVAYQALHACGVTPEGARERVEGIVGYGDGDPSQKPFTPRSKKVLELALRESMQLGHDYIGTEHILLGLLAEGGGVAARVLSNLDIGPDAVRREVLRRITDAGPEASPFDEVEQSNGGGEGGWSLFRGRVGGIRTELDLPRPVAVTVAADYAYLFPAESADGSTLVEPGDVADLMRTGLREVDSPRLEAVITTLGGRLLDTFPAMLEVSVSVSGAPESAEPPTPTFSVSATFRR